MDRGRKLAWGLIAAFVHRPVTTTMVTVALVLFGCVAVQRMPVELLPNLSYASITVQTNYPNTVPSEVEELVTRPIEEVVGGVPGVVSVESVSREGQSEVVLDFAWGTPIGRAMADVREKLDRVRLPIGVESPIVLRYDPAQEPILRLALTSEREGDTTELTALRTTAEYNVKRALEKLEGVAAVVLLGGDEEEIRVELQPDRLAALRVPASDVVRAITTGHISRPGGVVWEGNDSYLIRTVHEARGPEDLGELIVRAEGGAELLLKHVAHAWRGPVEREDAMLLNGRESVELSVFREGDANLVAAAERVVAQLDSLDLPPGQRVVVLSDRSLFISAAIQEVVNNALVGGALAICVLLFFLRDLRSTLIIALAIPLSLLVTFVPLRMLDVSLNLMSLGGLALGVGMLVDSSIVVLEAIARERERRPNSRPKQSAVAGAAEVGGSVVTSTLTTVAVFLPMAFVAGVAGQLVRDLSLAVSISILSSMLVSLTVVPVLESLGTTEHAARAGESGAGRMLAWVVAPVALFWRLIRGAVGLLSVVGASLARPLAWLYDRIEAIYPRLLPAALRRRAFVLLAALAICSFGLHIARSLGRTLMPEVHQGEFYVELRLPPGTSLERTTSLARRLGQLASDDDRVDLTFARIGSIARGGSAGGVLRGPHLAQLYLRLKPATSADFELAEQHLLTKLRARASAARVDLRVGRPELLSFEAPLEVQVYAEHLPAAVRHTETLSKRLSELEVLSDVSPDQTRGRPEVQVEFDRHRLALLGFTVEDAAQALQRAIRGEVVGVVHAADKQLNIRVQLPRSERSNVEDVARTYVGIVDDLPVRLGSVAKVEVATGPSEVRRIDGRRGLRIRASPVGQDLEAVARQIREQLQQSEAPGGVQAVLAGQADEMARSLRSLALAAALALFLVYVVMASGFESLHHPLLIMFTVPLAFAGVVFASALLRHPISAMAAMGAIILGGIAVNNAIVLIAAVNQRRGSGMDVHSALVEAARVRVRPILMTTATTVLGLLPMALGLGQGAALRQPLAVAVIGGLLVATPLTLLVVPCVYALLPGRTREAWRSEHQRPDAAPATATQMTTGNPAS